MRKLLVLIFMVSLGFCSFPKREKPVKLKTINHSYNMYLDK